MYICTCGSYFLLFFAILFLGSTPSQVEKKTASLAVPTAVEDDLDGTSKRKKGEQTPGCRCGALRPHRGDKGQKGGVHREETVMLWNLKQIENGFHGF